MTSTLISVATADYLYNGCRHEPTPKLIINE